MEGLALRHRENDLGDSIADFCFGCKGKPFSQNVVGKFSYNMAEQKQSGRHIRARLGKGCGDTFGAQVQAEAAGFA